MRELQAAELSRMQGAQVAAMMDTCERLKYVKTGKDEYGKDIRVFEVVATLPCGLEFPGSRREAQGGAQAKLFDAQLRLPVDTVLEAQDRIRVTKRFGVLLTEPMLFEIASAPGAGPSGLLINLNWVTNEYGR